MMIWDRLGIITDEVCPALPEALDWMVERGLKHAEIRMVEGRNIMELSDAEVIEVRHQVERRGLFVSGIASPIFKCALDPTSIR
jgi:L-ribulose-5-phosphate 3-epimerase